MLKDSFNIKVATTKLSHDQITVSAPLYIKNFVTEQWLK